MKTSMVRFLNSKGQWVIENCHDIKTCREHKDKLAKTKQFLNVPKTEIILEEEPPNPMEAFNRVTFEAQISVSEYKTKVENFYSVLNNDEHSAILHYSDSGHKKINLEHDDYIKYGNSISNALLKAPEASKTVFRAGNEHRLENLSVGDEIAFPAFISTSYSPQAVFKFVNKEEPVIYRIETNKGAEISVVHDEMEALLPKGLKFKVENIEKVDFWAAYPDTDFHTSLPNVTLISISEIC